MYDHTEYSTASDSTLDPDSQNGVKELYHTPLSQNQQYTTTTSTRPTRRPTETRCDWCKSYFYQNFIQFWAMKFWGCP